METTHNLGTLLDTAAGSLGHAARALVWMVAALVCAMLAGLLGMTAIIVSLWDTQHLLALITPGIGFAVLALIFAVVAARALRAQRAQHAAVAVTGGTLVPGKLAIPDRRLRPLTWLVALLSLFFLGGSREFVALALRFRAVLVLIAHALHVLQLFSRRRQPPL
jgi:tellurite resistance protein TehA-like permease